jgi:ribonuclease H / adenosylcobalamin/alpha-ribazole phosphatase
VDAAGAEPAPRLYLVRHGETEHSLRRVYSGRGDVPLTATGRAQARRAGALLAGAGVDLVACSPLRRAHVTAAAIAEATGAPLRVDERLTEVDYGPLEGLDLEEGLERFGPVLARWRADPFGAPMPDMEPLGDALARVRAATRDALAAGDRPVLVAHQGTLRLVLIALGRLAPEDYFSRRLPTATPLPVP